MTLIEALRVLLCRSRASTSTAARLVEVCRWGRGKADPRNPPMEVIPSDLRIDLADPATVGCLLALLREASGAISAWVQPEDPRWPEDGYEVWLAFGVAHVEATPLASTEGEAIASALIALAGEVTP